MDNFFHIFLVEYSKISYVRFCTALSSTLRFLPESIIQQKLPTVSKIKQKFFFIFKIAQNFFIFQMLPMLVYLLNNNEKLVDGYVKVVCEYDKLFDEHNLQISQYFGINFK